MNPFLKNPKSQPFLHKHTDVHKTHKSRERDFEKVQCPYGQLIDEVKKVFTLIIIDTN